MKKTLRLSSTAKSTKTACARHMERDDQFQPGGDSRQLVKAVEPGRVSFRMLHSKDYSPLLRRMVCPKEEKIVPPDEIVRGYEIGPDKYILVTDEELESVSPERSRTIEIIEFIDMEEVDSIYYDHPYYLVPVKGGEKAYRLLVEVMRRT